MTTLVLIAVLLLSFLFSLIDPAGILFAIAGLVIGLVAHSLFFYFHELPTWKKRAIFLFKLLTPIIGISVFLAVAVCMIAIFSLPLARDKAIQPFRPPTFLIILSYLCRVNYDGKHDRWVITDELVERESKAFNFGHSIFDEKSLLDETIDESRSLVTDSLTSSGWAKIIDQDGKLHFVRVRTQDSLNHWYPFQTVNAVPLLSRHFTLIDFEEHWRIDGNKLASPIAASLLIGNAHSASEMMGLLATLKYTPKIEIQSAYAKDSNVTVIAPKDLIRTTYPMYSWKVDLLKHDDVEMKIPLESQTGSELRMELRSPLVRNKAAQWVYEQAVLPAAKWVLLTVFGMLGIVTRDRWLMPPGIRLLRRLGIAWPLFEWRLSN